MFNELGFSAIQMKWNNFANEDNGNIAGLNNMIDIRDRTVQHCDVVDTDPMETIDEMCVQ